jgi:dienelactone hydrolase
LGAYPDLVDAVAVAHPTGISFPDDFEQCKRPILFLCAQHDHTFSDEQRDGGRDILETRSIWNKFVIYKGTNHGFAVISSISTLSNAFQSRGDENNEIEALAMEQAKEETVSFFTKFLR